MRRAGRRVGRRGRVAVMHPVVVITAASGGLGVSTLAAVTATGVVLGTVLVEPVLLALRRLAQREASAARFPLTSSDL